MKKIIIIILTFSSFLSAGIVAHTPIGVLEGQSDAIVIGDLVSVSSTSGGSSLVIRIERSVKGAYTPGTSVTVQMKGSTLETSIDKSIGLRMWFLNGSNVISRMNIHGIINSSFPAVDTTRFQVLQSGSSLKHIVLELLASVRELDMDMDTRGQIEQYFSVLPPKEREVVQKLLNDPEKKESAKLMNLSFRIRSSNANGLYEFAALEKGGKSVGDISSSLCSYRNPNPEGVAMLNQLFKSSADSRVRLCALYSLKAIHTDATIEPLVAILEESSVPEYVYLAASGLYFAANSGRVPREEALAVDGKELARSRAEDTGDVVGKLPPYDVFLKEMDVHIAFWKGWVLNRVRK